MRSHESGRRFSHWLAFIHVKYLRAACLASAVVMAVACAKTTARAPNTQSAAPPPSAASLSGSDGAAITESSQCLIGGNVLVASGPPDNFVFAGRAHMRDPIVSVYGGAQHDYVTFGVKPNQDANSWWELNFTSEVAGLTLGQKQYHQAARSRGRDRPQAGFDVTSGSHGCERVLGDFRIDDVKWIGDKVERFTAVFAQHCDEQVGALTGCIHFDNPFLRQADAELSGAPPPTTSESVPAANAYPPTHQGYRAHDPSPCLGGGSVVFTDAGPGDRLTSGQRLERMPLRVRRNAKDNTIYVEGEQNEHRRSFSFGTADRTPLSPRFYTMIQGDRRSTGSFGMGVGYTGCQVAVARFRVHELAEQDGAPKRGTFTYEMQCERAESEVMRGCVHFEN
jgi:hypothetical protein